MLSKRVVLIVCMTLLFALLCLIITIPGQRPQSNTIRILISTEKSDRLDFSVYGPIRFRSRTLSRGTYHVDLWKGSLRFYDSENTQIASCNTLELTSEKSDGLIKIYNPLYGSACYKGRIRISPDDSGYLRVIAEIPVDDYVRDVVCYCGRTMPEEAIKALTVITNNYASARCGVGSVYDSSDTVFPYAGFSSGSDELLLLIQQVLSDRLISDGSYVYPVLRNSNNGIYRIIPSSPAASSEERRDPFDSGSPILASGNASSTPGSYISLSSLCARAASGQSYKEILSFYFPYASLVQEEN